MVNAGKGKFIVFEGIDGCGKGTILEMTRKWLIKKKIPEEKIIVTQEPWTSEYGKRTREILKNESNPESKSNELLDLYLRDRKEHLEKEVEPALEQEKISREYKERLENIETKLLKTSISEEKDMKKTEEYKSFNKFLKYGNLVKHESNELK